MNSFAPAEPVTIEQLRYTWAAKGLHGMGMYQPVAASAGILNEDQSVQQLVYRLCRFDRSSNDQAAPSYGWIDAANRRFAFCRTFLSDLQVGRPGNFAAHVLVADPSDLPADHLLALFESNFWWTQPGEDDVARELPTLSVLPDPGRLVNPSAQEEDLAQELLQRMLDGERSIQVVAAPRSLVAGLRSIASVLPRLVDQRSISTWESGDPRDWFDIVGVELAANPDPPQGPRPVASFLLNAPKFKTHFGQALGNDTLDPNNLSSFNKNAHLLRQLEMSESIDQGEFLLGIALNATTSVVLEFESAQDLAARLIVEGNEVARQALHKNAAVLSSQVLANMGRLVAFHLPSDSISDDLGLWVDRMPPALMDGLLRGLQEGQGLQPDPSIPKRWPKQILLAALRQASDGPHLSAGIVASAAVKGELVWVFDHLIAEPIRADLLHAMLLAGRSRLSAADTAAALTLFARITTSAPALVVRVLADLPVIDRVDLLLQLLEELPGSKDPPPGELLYLVSGLLAEIPASTAGELLLRIDRRFSAATTPVWDDLVDEVLRRLVETIVDDPRLRYPPALFRLRGSVSSSGSYWRDLIDLAFGPLDDLLVREPKGYFDQTQRHFLIDAATAPFMANPTRLGAILELAGSSAESAESDIRYLLLAARRASSAYDHPDTTALILRHVGQSVLDHAVRLGKPPSESDLAGLAAGAFEALASNDKELARGVLEFFERIGKRARPWTNALKTSARRENKRGSRTSRDQ